MALQTWLLTTAKECPPSLNPRPLLLPTTFISGRKRRNGLQNHSSKGTSKEGRGTSKDGNRTICYDRHKASPNGECPEDGKGAACREDGPTMWRCFHWYKSSPPRLS